MEALAVPDAERVVAEVHAAGASGLEELDGSDGTLRLLLYAPVERAGAVRAAAERVVGTLGGHAAGSAARVGPIEPVEDVAWSEEWKRGLRAVVVSPRLLVRPPFAAHPLGPGQCEVVIDPGQAFGTGGHASTLLALEWIDRERERVRGAARILDVGTGSGVLALAALVLGAARAVAFDLDPVAVEAARAAGAANGLGDRLDVYAGPIEALVQHPFPVVVANLLKRELLPLLPAIGARIAPGGCAVLSGLLAAERSQVEAAAAAAGLVVRDVRSRRDGAGDHWIALLAVR